MKGRKPKPFEKQILEGDPRKHGKRKLQERADAGIKVASGLPGCPTHLHGRARSAWKFWATELEAMGLDKRPDGPMLEGACKAYERAVDADLIVERDGLIVEEVTEKGDVKIKKHPAVEISNRSWLIVKAFSSEFGLSPVSRLRLSVQAKEAEDDLAALLSRPRQSGQSSLVQ